MCFDLFIASRLPLLRDQAISMLKNYSEKGGESYLLNEVYYRLKVKILKTHFRQQQPQMPIYLSFSMARIHSKVLMVNSK